MKAIVFMCVLVLVRAAELVSGQCQQQIVNIYRKLPPEAKPLQVQCKFGGEALPPQTLFKDQRFQYQFCKSSAAKTLSCTLVWGNKSKSFDAFQDIPNRPPIQYSDWSANVNGISLIDTAGNTKFFRWD